MKRRSNDAWIAALRGRGEADRVAVDDLADYLRKVLAKILRRTGRPTTDDIADLTQQTLLRLVEHLDAFRGDSAFTTWATAVATRVAFTELRRRRARDKGRRKLESIARQAMGPPDVHCTPAVDELSREHLLAELHRAIETQLTGRQKMAIVAELRGVPTIEIADKLETNQNALYKLHHDARKKLRAALIAAGFTPELIHESFAGVSNR